MEERQIVLLITGTERWAKDHKLGRGTAKETDVPLQPRKVAQPGQHLLFIRLRPIELPFYRAL